MALSPKNTYPGQTDPDDPGYPHGKARNAHSLNDGTGFPIERRWINDTFGFHQALLDAVGIEPSGNPDMVGASQYLQALDALYYRRGLVDGALAALAASKVSVGSATYRLTGSALTFGQRATLTAIGDTEGFETDNENRIIIPKTGRYRINGGLIVTETRSGATAPIDFFFAWSGSGSGSAAFIGQRTADNADERVVIPVAYTFFREQGDLVSFVAGPIGGSETQTLRQQSVVTIAFDGAQ